MVTQVARHVLIETPKQLSTERRLIQIVLVAFLGAVSLMAACGTRPGLGGSEWQLEELEGAPPLEGTTITLAFERSRVSGSAGCNAYFGDYRLSGNRELTIPEIGRTLMECNEPPESWSRKRHISWR
jgi:heat shock protein HslJ